MAESKRRGGEDAVDEHLDEVFVDDDALDGDLSGSGRTARRNSSAVTRTSKAASARVAEAPKKSTDVASPGLFDRIARFVREVVAELRKVNWPSRNELLTYTVVVVVFVVVMMSIVGGLDWGFAWLVTHVFG